MLKRQLSIKSICFYSLPSEDVVIEPFLIVYDYDERSNRVLSYKKLHIQDKGMVLKCST